MLRSSLEHPSGSTIIVFFTEKDSLGEKKKKQHRNTVKFPFEPLNNVLFQLTRATR